MDFSSVSPSFFAIRCTRIHGNLWDGYVEDVMIANSENSNDSTESNDGASVLRLQEYGLCLKDHRNKLIAINRR